MASPPIATYTAATLAELLLALMVLANVARDERPRGPADVKLRKPMSIALSERTTGDGAARRSLVIDIR